MSGSKENNPEAHGQLQASISTVTTEVPLHENVENYLEASQSLLAELGQKLGEGEGDGEGEHLDLVLQAIQDLVALYGSTGTGTDIGTGVYILHGRHVNDLLFRMARNADADRAVLCFQRALDCDPGNVKASNGLTVVRHFQYQLLGHRWLLDEAIDLACEALVNCSSQDIEFIDSITFVSLCLRDRAELDGCLNDLDVAVELLRLGMNLDKCPGDSLSSFHLKLADHLALRHEITENEEDLNEAKDLIHKTTTTSARLTSYKNSVSSEVSRIMFRKSRQRHNIFSALECYTESLSDSSKFAGAATLGLADILWESYYVTRIQTFLSTAHNFAKTSLKECQRFAQDWKSHYSEHEVHTVLGEVQRSGFHKYNALDMLNTSIFHFRESAKLVDLKDSRFRRKAVDCCSAL